MPISAELRRELEALSPQERHDLAAELHERILDEKHPDWRKAWTSEIGKRSAEVAAGKADLFEAEDVHREIRDDLDSLRR